MPVVYFHTNNLKDYKDVIFKEIDNYLFPSNIFIDKEFIADVRLDSIPNASKTVIDYQRGYVDCMTPIVDSIISEIIKEKNDKLQKYKECKGNESIKEFCRGVKDSVVSTLNKIQEIGNTEIHIGEGIKHGYESVKNVLSYDVGSLFNTRGKNVARMAKMDPHTEVKPMLIDSIEALASDMAKISEAA